MRYALISDIHGNLEALESVLADMERVGQIDECLCLGDIVGYGANPEECLTRIRELGCLCIAGNHDHAAVDRLDITFFNQYARVAAQWTGAALSEDSRLFLRGLSFIEHTPHFAIVHGSLQSPELFNYVQTVKDAEFNFRSMDKPLLFLGHSHQPLSFFNTDPMTYSLDSLIELDSQIKTIINIGSVGQPRDENPLASYAIYDEGRQLVEIRRVEYDVELAAGKIIEAGLPEALALRLSLGK